MLAQGGCGASILGLLQGLTGHGPGQLGLGGPASAGVWTRGSSPSQPFLDQRIVLISTQEDSGLHPGPSASDNSLEPLWLLQVT